MRQLKLNEADKGIYRPILELAKGKIRSGLNQESL